MSVAFTRDEDFEAAAANLPDRPVSPHPNLVTPEGLAQLEAAFAEAKTAYTAAQASGLINEDRTAMARATRDLRYYTARLGSAQRIDPVAMPERVVFGCTVTILREAKNRENRREQTFRIVGEDEADPTKGSVSWVSPLARALLGKDIGDEVQVGGAGVEIMSIR
ncbi:transcription elongation factor GreA [Asticcacaulis taihuensis]|uniref:transcription elongation factor GreA n=1 Tax=Asticcacaulis taihuensis TaxID=260084 RepID=UPI0026EE7873|nr:transcription elongation factor GreA [Asticcacaulis taihuensis]